MQAQNYLHRKSICHRDLKPENYMFLTKEVIRYFVIMKQKSSELILIDFGLSKYYKENRNMKTRVGTCFYIAPEVLRGKYTESCDIWSLGVILYVLLFGEQPFDANTDSQIYKKILYEDFNYSNLTLLLIYQRQKLKVYFLRRTVVAQKFAK